MQAGGHWAFYCDQSHAEECRPGGEEHPASWGAAGGGKDPNFTKTGGFSATTDPFLPAHFRVFFFFSFALVQDNERDKKNKRLIHQQENSVNLGQAEELLKDLFLDVSKAKKLKHPQTSEIERE